VLGKLVVDDGNSTAVVMSRNDVFGNPLRELTAKAIRQAGGQVLDSFSYDPNARDYSTEVERIKATNPNAIVLIGFAEDARIIDKMIREGIVPRNKHVYLAGANTSNTLVAQVSPQQRGVLAGLKGTPLGTGDEAFVARLRAANPGLQDMVYAAQSYDAVIITALAAAIAGTDEPTAIAKEINGVTKSGEKCTSFYACITLVKSGKNIDYDGPSGPLDFTDAGEPCSATYVISEIQPDGTVKPLRDARVGC
jgi:branched-chain amino acid transport system substrate-binding protein